MGDSIYVVEGPVSQGASHGSGTGTTLRKKKLRHEDVHYPTDKRLRTTGLDWVPQGDVRAQCGNSDISQPWHASVDRNESADTEILRQLEIIRNDVAAILKMSLTMREKMEQF